jgi:hypothetical protein
MKNLLIAGLTVCTLAAGAMAGPARLGFGAKAGLNFPIVQEDQKSGSIFGFNLRYQLIPNLVVEPNIMFGSYGTPDPVDGVDLSIDGSSLVSYGVDATLGNAVGKIGFKPYAVAGVGFYKQSNDQTDDIFDASGTKLGWSGGFGFGFGISPKFDLDLRGKVIVFSAEGGGTKKSAALTGGVNYYLGGN